MLYTVNNSTITKNDLDSLLLISSSGSPILFYEDGVYSAMAGACNAEKIENALQSHPIFALQADLEARGIKNVIKGIQVVDYEGFVELVEEHDVVPWLRS